MEFPKYSEDFTHGACADMPNELYHADSAVSLSKLKVALESVEIYYRKYVSKDMPDKTSDALRKGSAQHAWTLEGEAAYYREFSVVPDLPFRKKEDKWNSIMLMNNLLYNPLDLDDLKPVLEYKKEDMLKFFAGFPGKQQITQEEFDALQKVDRSIKAHPIASKLLEGCTPEISFRSAIHPELKFAIQCRPDAINAVGNEASEGFPYIVDLKTVESWDRWDRNYNDFDYWMQEPFYLETINQTAGSYLAERLYFIVAETQYPYRVKVVRPDSDDAALGLIAIREGFNRIHKGITTGSWNDQGWDEVQTQSVFPWKQKQIEQLLSID